MTEANTMATVEDAPHLLSLNPEQQQAVETTEGPLLVLAGAGTGKTRVLTTRIAHILLNRLAMPGQILAVTFTNKAAREMAERVESLMGTGSTQQHAFRSAGMWLGTFHSIGAKMLRRHAEALGFTSTFTIFDADDQIRLLKTLMGELNIDPKEINPKVISTIIQSWKDRGLTPEKVTENGNNPMAQVAYRLYGAYQLRLKTLNAMDFGDLLLHMLTLFSTHPDILQEYTNRFRYILVDEYQDTNIAQYLWLRLLAVQHKNICCVGDDDQSIYGWRGAEVGNILKFEKDFPGAEVIRLERNYRSTSHILGAASGVIANNKGRFIKTLWTEAEGGEQVCIKSVWDGDEEARFVGDEIEHLQRGGVSLNEIAILVRAGFQTRSFEERFLTMAIPYRVIGGLRFYERMEIRDAVAYLRVIAQPDDDLAFERILNTPKRGVGKASMELLHQTAREQNISLYKATERLIAAADIKGKLGGTLRMLLEQFTRWRSLLEHTALPDIAELMLDESGYRDMWKQDKSPEAPGRLENLKELVQALGEFEHITELLEHVGLVMDTQTEAQGEMVSIMTLHSAKGLEFDCVFLPGWEEGVFPHQRAMDESGTAGLEEERRLAYVGITRAKEKLWITHAANRRIYNQWQSSLPSRFLGELPPEHVEEMPGGVYSTAMPKGGRTLQNEIDAIMNTAHATPSTSLFPKGTRVFHQKFGYGKVKRAQGDHLTISFEKAGEKKVLADYVQKS